MKKILLTVLVLLCFSAVAYLVYLNEAVLPQKIKSALTTGLENSTGKRVSIDSAKLNLLKGLVIKGLVISDDKSEVLSAGDITCRFLIVPFFKKEVVITALKLDSPRLLIERFPDNSINIVELFFKKPIVLMNGRLALTMSRIIISRGDIVFKDDTFDEPFIKDIKNARVDIRLFLPDRAAFSADFEIPSQVGMSVKSSGEYGILKKEFSARIEAKDFYPREFIIYCDEQKFNIPDGRVDANVTLEYKNNMLNAAADISGIGMKFSAGKIEADLNSAIKANIKYNSLNKELIYTGTAVVKNLALYNLGTIDKIYDIRGNISFSDRAFTFNDITATVLGLPVKAKAEIANIQEPALKIDAVFEVKLGVLEDILKNRFNIDIPLDMDGLGQANITLQYKNISDEDPVLNGSLDIGKALFKSEYSDSPLEDVTGRFDFTQNQLIFEDLEFKYRNTGYSASGTITNFQKPGVQLELNSSHISAKALFSVNDKVIVLSSIAGRFYDYGFSVQGDVDTTDMKDVRASLKGSLKFELSEDKEPYKNFKDKFKNLKLSGPVNADFTLKGSLNDIGRSMIDGDVKCDRLLINSFKLNNLKLNLTQSNGVSNIKYIRASIYGGNFEGNGIVDFASKDMPYQINGDIKNMRIEELKKDTVFKDKDISGIIQAHFGVKGFSNDPARLTAWGKLAISKGKLWQINLFKGIGSLLLRSDFNSVLFEEGSCSFSVKDKGFFTNDLVMKSGLLNLYGTVKVSFDKIIAASLRAEFTDEGVDASRVGDMVGAIERYSVIEIKGNLDEPKYKLRPDLSNVIGDIADTFFSQ